MNFQYQPLPSTSIDTQTDPCPDCGQNRWDARSDTVGVVCPACGRRREPDYSAAGELRIERSIEPHTLEELLRREAVNGWQLDHTRVDEGQPSHIIVCLRRRVAREFNQRGWSISPSPVSQGNRASVFGSRQQDRAKSSRYDGEWEARGSAPRKQESSKQESSKRHSRKRSYRHSYAQDDEPDDGRLKLAINIVIAVIYILLSL